MASWIVVPGAPRPYPQVGDWMRAGHVPLRFWEFAPSENIHSKARWRECNFEFMGPVHDMEETERFTSVRIPNPAFPDEDLVWLNIWCYENKARQRRGVNFATIVPVDMVLSWQQRGWRNRFLGHGVWAAQWDALSANTRPATNALAADENGLVESSSARRIDPAG